MAPPLGVLLQPDRPRAAAVAAATAPCDKNHECKNNFRPSFSPKSHSRVEILAKLGAYSGFCSSFGPADSGAVTFQPLEFDSGKGEKKKRNKQTREKPEMLKRSLRAGAGDTDANATSGGISPPFCWRTSRNFPPWRSDGGGREMRRGQSGNTRH